MSFLGFGKKDSKKAFEERSPDVSLRPAASGKAVKVPKQEKQEKQATKAAVVRDSSAVLEGSSVLLGTRVTEKASLLSEKDGAYTFNVSADANKQTIAASVAKLYKVHPVKVRIVPVPSKRVFIRGKRGVKSGGRKAYVFLKEGEKIDIA